jgi:hypothetical protein
MSGDSGEATVRAAIDAWNAGGVDAFLEHLTPDVEWHPPPGFPEGELFTGREAVAAALSEQFKAVFTSGRVEVRSVSSGTRGWLVGAHHEVEGQASGMDLAWRVYIVFQLEGDLISAMWAFLEREDALRQAGIDE